MKQYKLIAALLFALSISGCAEPVEDGGAAATSVSSEVTHQAIAGESTDSSADMEGSEPPLVYSELLQCRYFDESSFHLYDSRSEDYLYNGEILAGVVPHHLTAGHMISGFFRAAAESRPNIETVVIIAPQHYESDRLLLTSHKGWASPYGAISCDTEVSSDFVNSLGAVIDDEMLQYDHSASSHIPFVKRYLPNAKVACLLVSPRAGELPQQIADLLYELSQQKQCLFLFSIDFSHYLTPDEADANDAETLEAVLSADTAAIHRMSNDNVDSPYCLSTYVRLSQTLGSEITVADNSNTFKLLNYPYNSNHFPEGVTSYFVFITSK